MLKPSVPLIELGEPSASLSNLVFKQLDWASNYFSTSDFIYLSDGSIRILTTGIYRLETELNIHIDTSGAGLVQLQMYNNDVIVTNALSYQSYYNTATNQYFMINLSKTIYLKADDLVSVKVNVTDAAHTALLNGRLRITYIPLGGWNNNSGGSVINRGIRR
jgi:hypothetical protein